MLHDLLFAAGEVLQTRADTIIVAHLSISTAVLFVAKYIRD